MRIHIVTRDHTSDQILARLAALLAQHAAFTIGPTPDPAANCQLYFPYLEWDRFRDFTATKTAAWFTHKDIGRDDKERIWDDCARAVDLRLTCAPVYEVELQAHGLTARVTPPLDREMFTIGRRSKHTRRVIGTSGFVYPGGRKGEDLLARLALDFPDCEFKASGSGWPVPTQTLAWAQVSAFYRELDLYVCTSSIEGIGYGPLEAMATGIPVVIPRGVGVFDELPNLENTHRYTAGNYASLETAVTEALQRINTGGYNPSSLRGATTRYTLAAWHESHERAFERLLYDVRIIPPIHSWHDKSGVYYVAFGDQARECAVRAIASFKRYMPGIPVALVSDTPLNAGEDIYIYHSDDPAVNDIGGRGAKTRIYDLAPPDWEFVLYLDADTEVVADISFLFQLLEDGWSAVFCINPARYVLAGEMRRPDNEGECNETLSIMGSGELIQLNGGVFAFRRTEHTAAFFRAWHEQWQRYGARDQAALDRVLYTSPIRVYVLGNEWNTITRYLSADITAGILHYPLTARRWRGRINGRLDSGEAWAAIHPGGKA